MQNIYAHCNLGYRRKISEIIQLIRYENNERLGSDCLSDLLIELTTGIPIYLKIDQPVYSLVLFQLMT